MSVQLDRRVWADILMPCTTEGFERIGRQILGGIDDTSLEGPATIYSPLEALRAWLDEVEMATGIRPRMLRIPPRAWRELCTDPNVVERLKYLDNPALGTVRPIAELLGLDEIELIG